MTLVEDDEANRLEEDVSKFRIIHSNASESRGRSIPTILYDRSIKGRLGIGGRRRKARGVRFKPSTNSGLAHPSPSSVIHDNESKDGEADDSINDVLMTDSSFPSEEPMLPTESETTAVPHHELLKLNAHPTNHTNELKYYAEQCSVTKFNFSYLHLNPKELHLTDPTIPTRLRPSRPETPSSAVSTISIAYSPDGRTMASTHGDHTVKITCCNTGKLVRNLEGHPRTPWTVKYHPKRSNIVASGCLGFQVRVWDWNHPKSTIRRKEEKEEDDGFNYHERDAVLLNMIRLQSAIISLSFHPSGSILAVASGQTLHLWNYDEQNNNNNSNDNSNRRSSENGHGHGHSRSSGGPVPLLRYNHNLRCVHFPPGGDTIIVGGSNHYRSHDKDYALRLWDFDLDAALNPRIYIGREGDPSDDDPYGGGAERPRTIMREAMSNSRTFLHKALLYNDGGIDVSPDGKYLCGCADLWLPNGVSSAKEFLETLAVQKNKQKERENGRDEEKDGFDGDPNTLREAVLSVDDDGELDEGGESRSPQEGKGHKLKKPQNHQSFESPIRERYVPSSSECKTPPNPVQPPPTNPPILQKDKNKIHVHHRRPVNLPANHPAPPPPPLPPSQHNQIHNPNLGRDVPHVVVVSLDDTNGTLGKIIESTPLGSRAQSVTCVKFSPSAEFCLLGYGVRESSMTVGSGDAGANYHPASAIYRVRGGMTNVATMLSEDDDVNIAMFHPEFGRGFVYGTKQGRVRVLSPWPSNYYYD